MLAISLGGEHLGDIALSFNAVAMSVLERGSTWRVESGSVRVLRGRGRRLGVWHPGDAQTSWSATSARSLIVTRPNWVAVSADGSRRIGAGREVEETCCWRASCMCPTPSGSDAEEPFRQTASIGDEVDLTGVECGVHGRRSDLHMAFDG
jgi:hypothetical protein